MKLGDRIRQIMDARRLKQNDLAAMIGVSESQISRILNGDRNTKMTRLPDIAKALGTTVENLLGDGAAPSAPPGLSEDFSPFEPEPTHPFARLVRNADEFLITIETSALDNIGLHEGDVAVVSRVVPRPLKALRVYLVKHRNNDRILRQFVPPCLLITNASTRNELPLDTRKADTEIIGIITSQHRGLSS